MIARAARRIGCTEGQAWTLLVATLLAVITTGLGLPPAFRGGPEPARLAASAPPPVGPRVGPQEDVQVPTLVTLVDSPAIAPAAPFPTSQVPATSTTAPPKIVGPSTPARPLPLGVVQSGWASARGGTPVASAEVPEGALPVGARTGATDELSFIRLSGNATSLRIGSDDGPLTNGAAVLACPITDADWAPEKNIPLAEAPAADCRRGVAGVRGPDNIWSFDLSGHVDRAGRAGFVLMPAVGAGTFRIRFSP